MSKRDNSQLAKSIALILFSLMLLPLNTYALFSCYVLQVLVPRVSLRRGSRSSSHSHPKRVLISGINTSNGLALGRTLYQEGHLVIGADVQLHHIPGASRLSRAIKKFYSLPKPDDRLGTTDYMSAIQDIVKRERIDTFISCSAFTSPAEDSVTKEILEKSTTCKCLIFDLETTSLLSSNHDFLQYAKSSGVQVPETYNVSSRNETHKVLGAAAVDKKSFNISKVRKARLAQPSLDDLGRPLLPRRSISQTYQDISELSISPGEPHILQEYVAGEDYQTCAMVIRSSIESFAACRCNNRTNIVGIAAGSPLNKAMLKFTEEFIRTFDKELTGFLSFRFKVQEAITRQGYAKKLVPVSCNPRIQPPNLLLRAQSKDISRKLTDASQSSEPNGYIKPIKRITCVERELNICWIGYESVTLVLVPFWLCICQRYGLQDFVRSCMLFVEHLLFWKDATFELWDPLPFWWAYHVYWPARLLVGILFREPWSSIDVSTDQMYQ